MSGEVSDGYGSDLTNAEAVERFWRWSYTVARDFATPAHLDIDDLAQESLIAMWRVLEKRGGRAHVAAPYLTLTGRMAMLGVAQGSPLTGGDSTPGPKSRPSTVGVDWGSAAAGDGDGYGLGRLLEAADLLDAVDWAYHHGEILDCLHGLTLDDRTYVYSRFWQGKTDTEIAAERGVSNKMLGNRWKRTIRPALAERLSHLAGAS